MPKVKEKVENPVEELSDVETMKALLTEIMTLDIHDRLKSEVNTLMMYVDSFTKQGGKGHRQF